MLKAELLEALKELLQREAPLDLDTALNDLEEWDSLAVMSCMAWFDKKFGVKTKFSQYKALRTVTDLIALAKGNIQ